ncbi:hypothetical protein N7504_004415 [Penicillium tannophilum]|nr:hypothetical protein N7504_004415 [Penicillium tannophilum]
MNLEAVHAQAEPTEDATMMEYNRQPNIQEAVETSKEITDQILKNAIAARKVEEIKRECTQYPRVRTIRSTALKDHAKQDQDDVPMLDVNVDVTLNKPKPTDFEEKVAAPKYIKPFSANRTQEWDPLQSGPEFCELSLWVLLL